MKLFARAFSVAVTIGLMGWRLPVLLFVLWMLVSCASHTARKDPSEINWHERVGVYTYKQAQADFGIPAEVTKSPDGIIAEWVLRPSAASSTEMGTGSGFAGSQSASKIGTGLPHPTQGEKLRLKFGPDGKLID